MSLNTFGKVYLIGAGPGDPGLFTLKGKSILEQAQVVVYDRLVSPSILGMCNPQAKMVDVGKMPTHHKVKQSEINKLLVKFAEENPGAVIARLKGGDPFVFGRGGEEALELVEAGVEFEVVPGVTSAISVPAYGGIPVSHRGIATSFHIITGHEKDEHNESKGDEAETSARTTAGLDFEALAKCPGTLIFLMGISNMEMISRRLIECGKNPKTPLAFIEKGTTPYQRTVTATLETAAQTIVSEKVRAPAITIMGGVVELGKSLAWKKNLALSGKRLVVTRGEKKNSEITRMLSALGAEVIETPMIQTWALDKPLLYKPSQKMEAMETADFKQLENFELFVFTSVNGVEAFFKQLFAAGYDARNLRGKVACVGSVTGNRLRDFGIRPDYMPEVQTGAALGKLLASKSEWDGEKILLLQGNLADSTLLDLLPKATRWIVYETKPVEQMPEWKKEAVASTQGIVFASSSAVHNFMKSFGTLPENKTAFCIGPSTESTASSYGFETVTSDECTMKSLVNKIADHFSCQA